MLLYKTLQMKYRFSVKRIIHIFLYNEQGVQDGLGDMANTQKVAV